MSARHLASQHVRQAVLLVIRVVKRVDILPNRMSARRAFSSVARTKICEPPCEDNNDTPIQKR